ncbi:group II intron reverse transcriptase/maturase [Metabacillus herbersteinensis]|uniref:Group II intron reverse transcriptase/maturase n=1 Tax=Metabacillus herbersteinensis TaxID=283816 RepID=A0ABV6GIR6_9BACI
MRDKGLILQNEQELRSKLDGMHDKAINYKKPFYGLIELMSDTQTIMTAIHNIKSNKGSMTAGIDGKEVNYYLQMDAGTLIKLIKKSINEYSPKPVKRQYIPKSNSDKLRPLGIPTMLDRIIQELARIVLEPIVEAKFFKHSYGFRPYRATSHAVARTVDLINRGGYKFCIEGDIEGFFDNIDHNKLIEIMWNMGIRDKRYLAIIKKMLKAGVMEKGKVTFNDSGTPQGGIISPVLANIYLNNFDHLIAEKFELHEARYTVSNPRKNGLQRVKRRHDACYLIRYADDWIILCQSEEKAKQILNVARKYLKTKLKLNLSEEKTLITDLSERPAKFLGFDIVAEKARHKDKVVGKPFPNLAKLRSKHREVLKDIRKLQHDFVEDEYLAYQIEKINSKIVGISNYYSIGICTQTYNKLSWQLTNRMYKVIRKLKGEKWRDFYKPIGKSNNRNDRHKNLKRKSFMVNVNNVEIALTLYSFTPSKRALNFNQECTPYTIEGREVRIKATKKKLALTRPTLYNPEDLRFIGYKNGKKTVPRYYNFEYIMNREYAFNRDRGKCSCCKTELTTKNLNCHHKNPRLPLNEVNKVKNLTSLCDTCHKAVHGKDMSNMEPKIVKKIEMLQRILTKS